MNKSVLILDTPKDCGHCLLSDFVNGDTCLCRRTDRENNANDKPKWCPLRPLPKKIEIDDEMLLQSEQKIIEARAYNDCLDDITGETE